MNTEQAKRCLDKFLSKVNKTESCWLWTGSQSNGYGSLSTKFGSIRAHRLSFLIFKGEIPEGKFVCHNCPGGDNPLCVNPDHLWVGSNLENKLDYSNKYQNHIITKSNDDDYTILRTRVPSHILSEFRKICIEMDVSAPKQMAKLIEHFVQVQKENLNIKKMIKRK